MCGLCKNSRNSVILRSNVLLVGKSLLTNKKKLHGLSPRANYTDRATAACQRSWCQLFADRGCHVVSVTNPYGRILGFLDRSRYYCFKVGSSVVITRPCRPRSRPTTFFFVVPGIEPWTSGSVARNFDHQITEAVSLTNIKFIYTLNFYNKNIESKIIGKLNH
jgi:hypothetical protein